MALPYGVKRPHCQLQYSGHDRRQAGSVEHGIGQLWASSSRHWATLVFAVAMSVEYGDADHGSNGNGRLGFSKMKRQSFLNRNENHFPLIQHNGS